MGSKEKGGELESPARELSVRVLQRLNVGSLPALRAAGNLEFDGLSLVKRSVAVRLAEKWTKTSSPLWRWMKPKPLLALNHFTVPCSFTDQFLFI